MTRFSLGIIMCIAATSCSSDAEVYVLDEADDIQEHNEQKPAQPDVPQKDIPGPGPCDPSYVQEYVDKDGYTHYIIIPTICGPEEVYKGDPPPPWVGHQRLTTPE